MEDSTQHTDPSENQEHPPYDVGLERSNGSYYSLQKMNQMHHEIVRRIVVGQKDHEIADALGITKATVKYTRESPVVQQKLNILMGQRDASAIEMRKHLQELAPLALFYMEEIMADESETGSTRSRIAMDILDRAGYEPVHKTMDVTKMTEDRISEIKQRAREEGFEVEEAEIVEETIDGDDPSGAVEEGNKPPSAETSESAPKVGNGAGNAGEQPDDDDPLARALRSDLDPDH